MSLLGASIGSSAGPTTGADEVRERSSAEGFVASGLTVASALTTGESVLRSAPSVLTVASALPTGESVLSWAPSVLTVASALTTGESAVTWVPSPPTVASALTTGESAEVRSVDPTLVASETSEVRESPVAAEAWPATADMRTENPKAPPRISEKMVTPRTPRLNCDAEPMEPAGEVSTSAPQKIGLTQPHIYRHFFRRNTNDGGLTA
jgi:hypothetical protein